MDELTQALAPGVVLGTGTDAYRRSVSPENISFAQTPAAVVRPSSPADATSTIATAVTIARRHGLRVAVQATGHGAGGPIGDDTVLIDTSGLTEVTIDAGARSAQAGAGATWSAVQQQAEPAGLLGLSGTAPDVAVSGYTFAGGVGWLVRPSGLASASLTAVEFVDGTGRVRIARDDGTAEDRDALWSIRGGSPAGIATRLTFGLIPVTDLWAGYLLWPLARLDDIARAWTEALSQAAPTLTSTLAVLRLPPEGPFPEHLKGAGVVHLSYASTGGEADLAPMRDALRAAALPDDDTTGPADAASLARIHLDPPVPVPARGTGRWLRTVNAQQVSAILGAARIGESGGLNMAELRHVQSSAESVESSAGSPAPSVEGALTAVPAPFLLHAVSAAPDDAGRSAVDAALAEVEHAARDVDSGRSAPSFRDGQPSAADAFPEEVRARLRDIRRACDPDGVFAFQRAVQ